MEGCPTGTSGIDGEAEDGEKQVLELQTRAPHRDGLKPDLHKGTDEDSGWLDSNAMKEFETFLMSALVT